jgi:hypothetical protein
MFEINVLVNMMLKHIFSLKNLMKYKFMKLQDKDHCVLKGRYHQKTHLLSF